MPSFPPVVRWVLSALLALVLLTGIILFFVWISAHRDRPMFYLAAFAIPIPNANRRSGLAKLPVRFSTAAYNPNKVGIYYKEILASVRYGIEVVASGPAMQSSFYQAPSDRVALVQGTLTATGPRRTDPAWAWFADDISAGSVAMRLELNFTAQFKWYPKKHHLTVECDFRIHGNGTLWEEDEHSRCMVK